jgi:hypothetical protein
LFHNTQQLAILFCKPLCTALQERSKTNKQWATQNDESQNRLARKRDKLHEIIWEIELFIVYARKDRDSAHNLPGGMENYKPLQ